MVFQASLPKTLKQFEEYVAFLRNDILPSHVTTKNRWSFERKLSLWELNNDLLYLRATNDKPAKRFVPEWDSEFRQSLSKTRRPPLWERHLWGYFLNGGHPRFCSPIMARSSLPTSSRVSPLPSESSFAMVARAIPCLKVK